MTNFSTPNPGDLVAVSNLTQVFGPINDLETCATHWAGTTSGSVNAYTASLVNAPSSLTAGLSINLRIHASNTGASTLNLNGLGAVSIRLLNSALTGGELVVNATYKLIYDGTYFQVVGAGTSGGSVALADITDWPAGVSATEVGYLDGVSSSLQTQLNGKASSSHNHVPPSSGSDGNVTISGSVTLTRDMYYNNLTLASGGVLDPAQYQIFVAGTLAQTGGKIAANGTSGNTGSSGTNGGSGGAGRSAGTLGISGQGGAGANGATGAGATGTASTGGSVHSWGGRGGAQPSGGAGGAGSGGSGGPAGAPLGFIHVSPHERIAIAPRQDLETHNFVRGGTGGGGGGAGGGDGTNSGRGGGGGGGGGGMCLVFVNVLDLSGASGVLIESKGGAGGNSNGTGVTGNCGGGGGGQGGGGGYVGLYCNSVIGSLSNAIDVSGGAGGNGSNGAGTGIGGSGGRGGDGGNADFYRADTNTWTRARSAGVASGTAADAPSGVTGTTGGAGEVVRLSI